MRQECAMATVDDRAELEQVEGGWGINWHKLGGCALEGASLGMSGWAGAVIFGAKVTPVGGALLGAASLSYAAGCYVM